MPFDHSNRPDSGERALPLSRQLTHFGLLRLVRIIKRGNDLVYTRVSGLSDFEWRVLTRACDTPGMSINELGVLLGRSVAQVSRSVKRLVGLGLLRRDNVGGGPGVAIRPTAKGEEAYAPLIAVALDAERELTEGLSEAEVKTLERIIAVMGENAERRLAREQQLQSKAGEG